MIRCFLNLNMCRKMSGKKIKKLLTRRDASYIIYFVSRRWQKRILRGVAQLG